MADRSKAYRFTEAFARKRAWVPTPLLTIVLTFQARYSIFSLVFLGSGLRMAEWSKAPDLSSGSRKRAWQKNKKRVVVGSNHKVSFHLTRVSWCGSQDGRASNVPDLSSGFRKRAWVRTPLLTIVLGAAHVILF
ncbi:hypothetical protein TNCV_277751 [Trichonephila clavipes]|nr:hypothetical protein TNCV_277751 [Trichonephila clavipes]